MKVNALHKEINNLLLLIQIEIILIKYLINIIEIFYI